VKRLLVRGAFACAILPIAGFTIRSVSGSDLAGWFVTPGARDAPVEPRGGVTIDEPAVVFTEDERGAFADPWTAGTIGRVVLDRFELILDCPQGARSGKRPDAQTARENGLNRGVRPGRRSRASASDSKSSSSAHPER